MSGENIMNGIIAFVVGGLVGAMLIATISAPQLSYERACASVYARATTVADSVALARTSGCPFTVEPAP